MLQEKASAHLIFTLATLSPPALPEDLQEAVGSPKRISKGLVAARFDAD